jgi:hypothetical protein
MEHGESGGEEKEHCDDTITGAGADADDAAAVAPNIIMTSACS